MSPLEALHDFFLEHYSEVDLRRLARACSARDELSACLPGRSATHQELVFAAVEAFRRHGVIDAHFWQRLRRDRPHLAAKITALQALHDAPASASGPLQLVVSRVQAPRDRQTVEVEFALRNDGAVAQLIKEIRVAARNLRVDHTTEVRFSGTLDDGKLRISATNHGWSSVSFVGEISVRYGKLVETRRISLPKITSGDAVVCWESGTRKWNVEMQVRGELSNLITHELIEVQEDATVFDSRCIGGPHSEPDTTYICILNADQAEQQRAYRTLRTVAPGQFDIFQCAVTATKSAYFDLTIDIVDANDTHLSASHPGLRVSRDAHWEFNDFADGDIFILGPDNIWRLHDPKGARWRSSTDTD